MATKKFKTNLKCGGCKATVMPYLDAEPSISSWEVDLDSSDKVLTVTGDKVDSQRIVELFRTAGFEAKEIKGFLKKVFG